MSSTSAVMASPRAVWKKDLALALLATLVVVAIDAGIGFRSLGDATDNDSLLRLVEVRDLLAGQNWFDLHQYRMGPEGGFVMHWSRLVDAPIAAIIVAVTALTGSVASAETTARIVWPASMFCLTVFFTIRAARRFSGDSGDSAVVPALVTSAAALYFLGIYGPGALDHHNIQLMLTMASVAFLLAAPVQRAAAALSGICAALTLAIGMETAPYVAVIGLCVAGLFIFGADEERATARGYGLGFAGASALVFAATVSPAEWSEAHCDAFSSVQFVLASLAGFGLAAIASTRFIRTNRTWRLAALAVLGAALGAVVLRWFPECLAAPYSEVDPRLREYWMDNISEAQSMFRLILDKDASVLARYATPVIALALMALRLRQGVRRRQDYVVGAVLVAAFIVSVWQVRGSPFSIALAAIPLSAWIAKWREKAEANPTRVGSLKMVAVWLVSLNAVWTGAALAAAVATDQAPKAATGEAAAENCKAASDFSSLATEPDTTVLAVSDIGSPILAYSGHRALAGLYHRNVTGNLLVFDAFMSSAAEAKTIIDRNHIGLIALCPANPENKLLVDSAPDGFLAQLLHGTMPAWLEPVAETRGKPLELYRVKRGG